METAARMKALKVPQLAAAFVLAFVPVIACAKDEPVQLSECPQPVQAVIRHYQTQGTLEEIGKDKKKKSGGPAVYEAKFNLSNGKRVEVHISSDGKVLQFEEKKPKS